ncbi:response regulator transcription factor [Ureibacillus manganicus]|uniref:Heme response regulator HssR n=1 Tax=Ureibacillus manganicus DSM 26584 TaxID=1384049 RepID=A0A0A3IW68_9BACL|nr:response regulator transcription factor [Ureibacillus manganicus]KGR79072.1 heme transporter CcmC [Ureibacillus manganicus DSM 26584]
MKKIIVVDDDIHILELLYIHLSEQGYIVFKARDGISALEILHKENCHIAIVDVMMPFMDGYELTKVIRQQFNIPVILLTAKSQIDDKEKGFQAGTDDYVVKPFEPKELSYRIKALLRRYDNVTEESIIRMGSTTINRKSYEVQIDDRIFLLPLKEFELLYFLMANPKQVFSRDHLIEQIWGIDYEGDERTVDVHIKRLRERFTQLTDDFQIKTIRGIGYSLEEKRS